MSQGKAEYATLLVNCIDIVCTAWECAQILKYLFSKIIDLRESFNVVNKVLTLKSEMPVLSHLAKMISFFEEVPSMVYCIVVSVRDFTCP